MPVSHFMDASSLRIAAKTFAVIPLKIVIQLVLIMIIMLFLSRFVYRALSGSTTIAAARTAFFAAIAIQWQRGKKAIRLAPRPEPRSLSSKTV